MNTTETRILGAARSMLIREGSGGFSMRKVALEADITLSNVQYYFKSKNDLIDGLLNEFLKESKLAVQQCLQIPGTGKKVFINLYTK